MRKNIVFIIFICAFNSAYGLSKVEFDNTKISDVATYSNGDIIVRTQADSGECEHGFWLSNNEPGYTSVLSNALGSFRSGGVVKIQGDADQPWPGSSSKYCKLLVVWSK